VGRSRPPKAVQKSPYLTPLFALHYLLVDRTIFPLGAFAKTKREKKVSQQKTRKKNMKRETRPTTRETRPSPLRTLPSLLHTTLLVKRRTDVLSGSFTSRRGSEIRGRPNLSHFAAQGTSRLRAPPSHKETELLAISFYPSSLRPKASLHSLLNAGNEEETFLQRRRGDVAMVHRGDPLGSRREAQQKPESGNPVRESTAPNQHATYRTLASAPFRNSSRCGQ